MYAIMFCHETQNAGEDFPVQDYIKELGHPSSLIIFRILNNHAYFKKYVKLPEKHACFKNVLVELLT